MNEAPFEDRPPITDRVNAYDEKHLAIYVRLLMAEEEGADWREVVSVIFGLDSAREPDRAKVVTTAISPARDGWWKPDISSCCSRGCSELRLATQIAISRDATSGSSLS